MMGSSSSIGLQVVDAANSTSVITKASAGLSTGCHQSMLLLLKCWFWFHLQIIITMSTHLAGFSSLDITITRQICFLPFFPRWVFFSSSSASSPSFSCSLPPPSSLFLIFAVYALSIYFSQRLEHKQHVKGPYFTEQK